MQCLSIFSYDQAYNLCSGKRFAVKGRKLDNHTVIIKVTKSDGTRLEIRSWSDIKHGGYSAVLYPYGRVVIPSIQAFTANQQRSFFGLHLDRDKKKYLYVADRAGNQFLAKDPIEGTYNGRYLVLQKGTKVPTLVKSADASLEWRRAKQLMDRTFKTCCQLQAFSVYTDKAAQGQARIDFNTLDAEARARVFAKCVQELDTGEMARFLTGLYLRPWNTYTDDAFGAFLESHYKWYYERNRRDILVAAGARVET